MKRKRFSTEQIVAVLKQAEMGLPVAELVRQVGISEQTFYRWKRQYGGLGHCQIKLVRPLFFAPPLNGSDTTCCYTVSSLCERWFGGWLNNSKSVSGDINLTMPRRGLEIAEAIEHRGRLPEWRSRGKPV